MLDSLSINQMILLIQRADKKCFSPDEIALFLFVLTKFNKLHAR